MVALLALKNGEHVAVDKAFADWLVRHWGMAWSIHRDTAGNRRPILVLPMPTGRGKTFRLARLVTGAGKRQYPQHLNGNVMDCRRANIRLIAERGEAGYTEPHAASVMKPLR